MNATDLALIRRAPVAYYLISESFLDENHISQAFMPDTPYNLLKDGKANNVPWLIGINSAEFIHSAAGKLKIDKYKKLQPKLNSN